MFVYISMSERSLKYISVFSLPSFNDTFSKLTKTPPDNRPLCRKDCCEVEIFAIF